MALWTMRHGPLSFAELGRMAASAQALGRDAGLKAGDCALVLAKPGPRLFATVLALIGLGVTVVFVEPWMPVERIDRAVTLAAPKAFFGSTMAQIWGLRARALRRIPKWINIRQVGRRRARSEFAAVDVNGEQAAVITFTSGTTGAPKGIVRTNQYMWDMHDIFGGFINDGGFETPDLCLFPNVALLQLGTGRGAVLVPEDWSSRALESIDALPKPMRPETLTCGPAFLLTMLRHRGGAGLLPGLQLINVGGALTDNWIFEETFKHRPGARFTHVYGGTEAEPVSYGDARDCVRKTRERGLFQTLNVGQPIPSIRTRFSAEGLWVSGANVAPAYLGDAADNRGVKQVDEEGRLWHCMGDRIVADNDGWWLNGRASQPAADFDLEQRIYSRLETSKCFIHRDTAGIAWLCGEGIRARVREREVALDSEFPEIAGIREVKIVRDRRHRARIDRVRSLGGRTSDAS
jgi:olefin beta-lactone synthetase